MRTALDAAVKDAGLSIADLTHVVIGTPGAVHPVTGQLGYARHLPGWHSPGILESIRADLGVGVDIENDVNLAAVAELWEGVATSSADFALLWVGEGIGLAIVLDGVLHRGATGGAGEVGYMPVPGVPLSRAVSRGGTGGFQALTGGAAVLALARTHGIRGDSPVTVLRKSVSAGDATQAFLGELAARLATGLAAIVAVLDPDLVALSGEVLLAGGETLRDLVDRELRTLAIPHPRLVLGAVTNQPVRVGAIHAALTVARRAVFGTTRPDDRLAGPSVPRPHEGEQS